MDATEARNLERVKLWEATYNDAIDRMVDECYAPDCEVIAMARGQVFHGRDALRKLEHEILAANPERRMTVTKTVASVDTVAVECVAEGIRAGRTLAAVFLVFNADGQIVSDHTYGSPGSGATASG
jgi:hypothetical protein